MNKTSNKKKIVNEYTDFMGAWMAGSAVGHFLSKIIIFCFMLWFLSKVFC